VSKKSAQPDIAIATLAASQHGVVSTGQLLDAGLAASTITERVKEGRLHRLHQGVYAVGHPGVSSEGRWMAAAAVLACRANAALSHRSAAALWKLLPPSRGPVDVSVPSRAGRSRRAGIRVHRCFTLAGSPGSIVVRRGIPVTSVPRTIADVKRAVPAWQWRRAVRQAEFLGLPPGLEIETDRTRSDLEGDFLRLCRQHRIPAPEVNVRVGSWTVDFLWREERVAVETDFYGYHRGRVAFRDDRARDLALRRRGFAVHRFSEEQVDERPAEVAGDLRDALGLAS
jgi:very-short-patch-repair endonuclease